MPTAAFNFVLHNLLPLPPVQATSAAILAVNLRITEQLRCLKHMKSR